jgi:hypothetical protein
MNKKTIYIIVAVLVVIIVIGAAAYVLMNNGGNGGTTPTPTPSPTQAPTVVDASTLQFSVTETTNGVALNYNFAAKNVNTTTEVMRMDIIDAAGNYSYVIDLGAATSFLKSNDGAWTASGFNTDVSYIVAFADYQTALVNWDGHAETYSYTASSGSAIVISAIHVNPTLADSLFATS